MRPRGGFRDNRGSQMPEGDVGDARTLIGFFIDIRHGETLADLETLLVTMDQHGRVRVGNDVDGQHIGDVLVAGTEVNLDIARGIAERLRQLRAA